MNTIKIILIERKSVLLSIFIIGIIGILIFLICFWQPSIIFTSKYYKQVNMETADGIKKKLAIVIDDFGSSRDGVKEMMELQIPLTFAVMPFMEYTEQDSKEAYAKGYEVILHLSMEPHTGKKSWLGPRPILTEMNREQIILTLQEAFAQVPFTSGVNNHMGSKATEDEELVRSIMEYIKDKNVYFLDSRTSPKSVIRKIGQQYGVKVYERNIFIDGTKDVTTIKTQLQKACRIAGKYGKAIAIGHVGAEGGKPTAKAIKDMIGFFAENNVELVFVSQME